jgi:hypothetical protein
MTDSDIRKEVLYCPHCGNTSVQTLLLTQNYMASFYSVPDGERTEEPSIYSVVKCETCSEILVYTEHEEFPEDCDTPYGDISFPKQSSFTDAVPESIRSIYREAVLVKNISPTAYVILARRVLEEICRERGVTTKNLVEALAKLSNDGVIPSTLSEATKLIRLVGNAGAHASGQKITMLQVWTIDDFIKAIIEYIYVAPKKIEEFKRRFSHFSD